MANFFNVNDVRKNPTLDQFAYRSILSTPGTAIHDGKVLKKKEKMNKLISKIGYYGPILDLMIRGTANHLVVYALSKEVRAITSPENGDLFCLLKKHFFNDQQLWNGIVGWFKNNKAVEDYEINFRNFRCEVLNSLKDTIVFRPQSKVYSSLDRFSYGSSEILNFETYFHGENTMSNSPNIFGIYGYDGHRLLIYPDHQGPWHDAVSFVTKCQNDINEILAQGINKFPVRLVDFFKDDTRNLSKELEEVFNALKSVDRSNINLAKRLAQDLQKYIEVTMRPDLLKLEVIILLNAFMLKSKPICDLFYCFDTSSKKRVMRDSKDFQSLVGGCFMVLYYKLLYMTLIQKMSFDGVENMDLFSMLTDQRNSDMPSYKVLGKKVSEDCSNVFWYPNEDTRKKNMVSIIKIARELGLYKDNYNNSNGTQPTTIESEEENSFNDSDQPPMFLGDKKTFFPKRRRHQHCDISVASLVDSSNLSSLEIPNQSSVVDDVTSIGEGLRVVSQQKSSASASTVELMSYSNASCKKRK